MIVPPFFQLKNAFFSPSIGGRSSTAPTDVHFVLVPVASRYGSIELAGRKTLNQLCPKSTERGSPTES
jgi:hypothetical protein